MLVGKPTGWIEAIQDLHTGGAPMNPQIDRMVIGEFQNSSFDDPFILT